MENRNNISNLLYFKLTLARPVEKDITKPRVNKVKLVGFDGGDAERIEKTFKMAISVQLIA